MRGPLRWQLHTDGWAVRGERSAVPIDGTTRSRHETICGEGSPRSARGGRMKQQGMGSVLVGTK
eukprot:scaffold109553_cov45-Prasinocladus_malaysianus.AAC.4